MARETGMYSRNPSVIFNDWHEHGLPASKAGANTIGTVTAGSSNENIGDVDIATMLELTAATLFHLVGASGSVEYSQALPDNCRRLSVQCQQDAITRYAWVTGKVATPTAPYWTLKAADTYLNDQLKLVSQTLYLGAATHTLTWEIEAWI